MSNSSKKYCTLEPVFPPEAFILFLFILHKGKTFGLIPLDSIYRSYDEASEAVTTILAQLSQAEHITVAEEAIIIPATFHKNVPMKKDYWKKPTLSYTGHIRIKTFYDVAQIPQMFSLLVTPYLYDDKQDKWLLNATLPLRSSDDISTVESFMYASDQVVEPRTKYAAIYSLAEKKRFNWKTKKVKKIEDSAAKMLNKKN